MATIRPFQAVRPKSGLEEQIAALPYDTFNREEARAEAKAHPLSFLKIDRAETQLEEGIDLYDERVYEKAAQTLRQMLAEGRFIKEEEPCFYVYELSFQGRTQTGLAACVPADDYLNQIIKRNENTREDKEQDRIRHVDVCNAQTGPIFLAYRKRERISELLCEVRKEIPLYDFTAADGVRHSVWRIADAAVNRELISEFSKVPSLYIADGHHRAASAVKVALKRRESNPNDTLEEEYNYFLAVLFADEQLKIMDYNRMVHDLNGRTAEQFLQELEEGFEIHKKGSEPYRPSGKGRFSLYLSGCWYELIAREAICRKDTVDGMDVSILQNEVLGPVLGIKDPRTDERIRFVGGIRGLSYLQEQVDEKGGAAFVLYPTSMEEMFSVSDEGRLMPPKSTWFEPKLRSGLLIHDIS